ncbi:alginate O-acetyltransferase AlgX-related protein [Pseudomonas sp. NY15354]|uniref:alginate O-acetyltransferase AlgX-related protein n=1 Tax=Pseudomonas sp. NY15354 TaxID=3400351 RepID=UPI003A878E64
MKPGTFNLKRLAPALLGASLALAVGSAYAAQESMVTQGKDGWLFPGRGSLTEVDNKSTEANTALIKEALEALAARNVKLQIVLLPDKSLFYQDKLPAGKAISPQMQQRYKAILGKLPQAGVPAFDDYAVLRPLQQVGKDVFYRTVQHWTQAAANTTAEPTAKQVKAEVPNLAGSAGTGMQLGTEFKDCRYGDLAELFLSPDEKKKLGRDTFTVRRDVAAGGLLDDAPAPVHVTGHSMVQPYFGYPQKLSNVLNRPVSVSWKPGNVGPWKVLLEYVESSEFKQSPP